jgi:hypothetical protein
VKKNSEIKREIKKRKKIVKINSEINSEIKRKLNILSRHYVSVEGFGD